MLPPSVKIYIATKPADMRKQMDGLLALVEQQMGPDVDPFSGHMFVFRNRRGDRVKILLWDRSGFWVFYKRLERGTFRLPPGPGSHVELEASELALLLEGIDLAGSRRRKRIAPRVRPSTD